MLKKCTNLPQNRHDFSIIQKSARKSVQITPKTDTFSAIAKKLKSSAVSRSIQAARTPKMNVFPQKENTLTL
jgi:hypothetical protein